MYLVLCCRDFFPIFPLPSHFALPSFPSFPFLSPLLFTVFRPNTLLVAHITAGFPIQYQFTNYPTPSIKPIHDCNMLDRNLQWWNRVNLPKTPSEWRKAAEETTFEDPSEDKEDAAKGEKKRKHLNPEKMHAGKRVIDVSLRDLSGWNSASKIQKSHFLAARILWHFKPLGDMTTDYARNSMKLSDSVDQISYDYLKSFPDWKTYRDDIKYAGEKRPPRGCAAKLGCFSIVRDQQWAAKKEYIEQSVIDAIALRTRSKTAASVTETGTGDGLEDESMEDEGMEDENMEDEGIEDEGTEYTSQSSLSSARDAGDPDDVDTFPAGDRMEIDSEPETPLSTGPQEAPGSNPSTSTASASEVDSGDRGLVTVITHGSDISVANAEMYPPSLGEEVVNVAAVTFLRVLTMWCPEVELEWEVRRMGFETQLGEAHIRAHTDGCLSSADNANNIHGIVEVKPFSISIETEKTLMQMGLEMLAFILYCELNGMPKER